MGRAGGGQLRRLCVCSRKTPRREARAGSGLSQGSGARRTGRGGGGQRRPRDARDAGSRPAPLPLVVLRVKVTVSTTPRPQHVSVPRRGTRQEPGGSGGRSGAYWGPQLRGVRAAPLQLSGSALCTPTSSLGRSRPLAAKDMAWSLGPSQDGLWRTRDCGEGPARCPQTRRRWR